MSLLKYPYTNLHELNLDWIIEQLNKENPVISVNGKQGIVTLTGQDINRAPNNPQTVEQAISSQGTSIQSVQTKIGVTPLPTTAQTLTGAIAEHETDITGINNKIGNTVLPTTAQTLTGATAELDGDVTGINNKIGNTALPTTAQTLTGAIAEHETDITGINNLLDLRLFNSMSYAEGVNQQITLPADLVNGQAYLVVFRHFTSATTFIVDTMLLCPVSDSVVSTAWIAKNSTPTLSNVSVSGRTVTLTFSDTVYCSIYFIKMK